jgi:hypothetical protein
MVDFEHETRKRCRHCKMNLSEPTSNARQAFCTRGCYQSFYLHRCRACEEALPKLKGKGRPRVLCKKAKCRNAWAGGEGFGRYVDSVGRYPASKNPEKSSKSSMDIDVFSASGTAERTYSTAAARSPHDFCASCGSEGLEGGLYDRRAGAGWIAVCADCRPGGQCQPEPDDTSEPYRALEVKALRPWRVAAAGSPISANAYHCAIVSDAPNGGLPNIPYAKVWADGDWEATENKNRKLLEKHLARLADIPTTATSGASATIDAKRVAGLIAAIPDDLSIPLFLDRRTQPQLELKKAA